MTTRVHLLVIVFLVALVSALPQSAARAGIPGDRRAVGGPGGASGSTSIMLVGDSITHGSVGDWTWRYFAWQHLQKVGASVDFVGPRRSVFVPQGTGWRSRYADPSFDKDHAALWGDRISWLPRHDRAALVETYEPDVVVLGLGTNDLLFGVPVQTVVSAVQRWVLQTRESRPYTDFVLLEVPGSRTPGAAEFNASLGTLAATLDEPTSRVVVARTAAGFRSGRGYARTRDTYDPHHPNARGQVRIAAAVTDALAEVGVGVPYPRPLAFVREGPRTKPRLNARALKGGARLAWRLPPGATSVDVFIRSPKKSWRRLARARAGRVLRVRGLRACGTYAFRVRARKGWTLAHVDMSSRVRKVRVTRGCR